MENVLAQEPSAVAAADPPPLLPARLPDVLEESQPTPQPVAMQALESTALNATAWTIVSYGAGQGLRLVNSFLLTRLLLPEAFGELTLVMTIIVGVGQLTDIGLAPSVIQSKRGDDPDFLNSAWTLQCLRGIALWLVSCLLAWPMSLFYKNPRLLIVLPVLALSCLINGLASTNLLTLSRHMGVRRLFIVDFSTQIFTLLVTVGWAFFQPNVWALVAGNIASNLIRLALSFWPRLVPGIRNRFLWDPGSIKEIVSFGKWIVLGTAFYFFASQGDKLLLGKFTTLTMLGVYGIAYNMSDIPRSVINAFSYRVGYPFIAKIIHLPRAEFRTQFLRYRMYTLLVGALLLSIMVVFGDLAITSIYKPAYHQAAWMVPILAVGLWHTLLYMTTGPVLLAMGKSKYNAVGNAAYGAAILLGIPVAFHFFHIVGAVIAVAAGDLPLYFVTEFGATREGVRPLRQDLLLTLCFISFMAAEYGLRHAFR